MTEDTPDPSLMDTRQRLAPFFSGIALAPREGYHRHWFNDYGNRVNDALIAGFTRCVDGAGDAIRRQVGVGRSGPLYAFALEIPITERDAAFERLRKAV